MIGALKFLLASGSSLKGTDERDQVLDLDWGEQILPCCHSLRYASSGNDLSDDSIKLGVGSSLAGGDSGCGRVFHRPLRVSRDRAHSGGRSPVGLPQDR